MTSTFPRTLLSTVIAAAVGVAACALFFAWPASGADKPPAEVRAAAKKAFDAGNFKDAYAGYAPLALDAGDEPGQVSDDLTQGIFCLQRLGRSDEVDDFREKVIAAHPKNWRLLSTAAHSFLNGETYGTIIAGKFYRGGHRGGDGKQVWTVEHDRVRALQLMVQASENVANEPNKNDQAEFYFAFAGMLLDNRYGDGAWKLQYLTDLSKLPDPSEAYPYYSGGNGRGAPVNEDGTPVLHSVPKTFKEAKSDGERWRWCLTQAAEMSPEVALRARYTFAEFLRGQFDVQTMAAWGYSPFGRGGEDAAEAGGEAAGGKDGGKPGERKDESGPFAVRTLGEDETIARLASGIKRFKLPEEFNFIHILQQVGDAANNTWGEQALNALAALFADRQQYDRSAEYWRKSIQKFGPGPNNYKQLQLDQIVNHWGQFDALGTEPAGTQAHAYLLFRNGKKISFEAYEIDVRKVLDDLKAYVKGKPNPLNWENLQVDNIGYRLVEKNQNQYLGKRVAQWDMPLEPREKHFDRRVKVNVPIKAPGAYLIKGQMEGGNLTQIVLWVADTAIVKKAAENGSFYYVADAASGQPIAKANLEFFGYEQRWTGNGNQVQITTQNFAEFTDAEGQLKLTRQQQDASYQWIITATTPEGRLAYHGFTGIWGGRPYDYQYEQTKVYVVTDRPVYRPGQTVKFKFWVAQAKYDQEGKSPFAGKTYTVEAYNPRNEKMWSKAFTADAFGGFDGELEIPKEANLGNFQLVIPAMGGSSFRVEEYKKPEYEVKIDAPTEPVALGEKVTATITAKYYFGAPVANAKVKYKIQRTGYSERWYPVATWDWFYGPGYWWFAQDYFWYPGFSRWGCLRPHRWWWPQRYAPPELVSENEVAVGKDGTVKVEIDTALAKAVHGDEDHKYEITAEVTDESRRTIVGTGTVLVARQPFKVYAWVDRGYYHTGDAIRAEFNAHTLDNKPVKGRGVLKLLKISYASEGKEMKPAEAEVARWDLATDEQGRSGLQLKADQPGQYRLSYTVTDGKNRSIEGGYVFVIRGEGFDGKQFRFNDVELTLDKKEYQPGDTVKVMVNTDRPDSAVLLFVRPSNGIYLPPKLLRLKGKSTVEEVAVVKKDMPNFFIEALTVSDAKVYDETREVVVPPESRVVNVAVTPSAAKYRPGEKATVRVKLTDTTGKPVAGSTVLSIYDKAVEYIAGGSNVPDIKAFFWKWRRAHYPQTESNLSRGSSPLAKSGTATMQYLGVFGPMVADQDKVTETAAGGVRGGYGMAKGQGRPSGMRREAATVAPMAARGLRADRAADGARKGESEDQLAQNGVEADVKRAAGAEPSEAEVQPTVRKNFADTALWVGALNTKEDGTGEVELTMPENLTTWKTRVWSMSDGTRVGQGDADVVTYKNLLVRLEAPRFFVQKDEVVLSGIVHNYLKDAKRVKAVLELGGNCLVPLEAGPHALARAVEVPANGEQRVDFRVRVAQAGEATVRVSALTDEESDAMEMKFPASIHGMLKTESFAGAMRPADSSAALTVRVPAERLPEQSVLEVRYSPSVAMAMVDALPYLISAPHGTTDETLNSFLPTVLTQRILLNMKLDLKAIREKRANLNAQQIGDDQKRAADAGKVNRPFPGGWGPEKTINPVFDQERALALAKAGVTRITNMQLSDGGWGWFGGYGEWSDAHTTSLVVHGLLAAKENDLALVPGTLERGVAWLQRHQAEQVQWIKNFEAKINPGKPKADNLDAFVFMVLTEAGVSPAKDAAAKDMLAFLYRDRVDLTAYAKAMFGLALHQLKDAEKLDMILQNLGQFVVKDDANQTAYLKLPEGNAWWYWYGSDTEANAYYLKLLVRVDPKGEKGDVAARLAKYIVNNRNHGTYWHSTRDSAICVEALADYVKGSGEDKPDLAVTVSIDGKKMKEVKITADNLFSYDNKLVLTGEEVKSGEHRIEFAKSGRGPLYFNAYLTNFTLEDPIKRAGLEITVSRKFYKLVPANQTVKVSGSRGQALDQKVEKYDRQELADGATLKSGDLVEVEMEIDSKNDYEYLEFTDMKAAGFEAVEVRSGYNGNDLHAYMELRDERTSFFARTLARGKHSVAYRLRAEIPGKFSALPAKGLGVYAPELRANSDEAKLNVVDAPPVTMR